MDSDYWGGRIGGSRLQRFMGKGIREALQMKDPHKSQQVIVALFVSVVFVAPTVAMLMDRSPPYTRVHGEIIPANPAPGDEVAIKWDIQVHRQCTPVPQRNITRTIIESRTGKRHEFEPAEGVFGTPQQTASGAIVRGFQMPQSVTPGPTRYRSIACFACNPLHYLMPVCVTEPEIEFTVKEK